MTYPSPRAPRGTPAPRPAAGQPVGLRPANEGVVGAVDAAAARAEAATADLGPIGDAVSIMGDVASDLVTMEANVVDEALAPFSQAPPSNPVAAASHYVNAAMGILGLVEQVQDVGIAALTAPLAQFAPPLPVMTLGAFSLGLPHVHPHPPSTVPPAPPVPLPSLGVVTAPGAISVLVGGLPPARAGDIGVTITCGTLGPPFELVLGSSNTFFGGGRAARIGTDMEFHDNPMPLEGLAAVMVVAGAVAAHLNAASQMIQGNPAAAAVAEAQQAAEALALALKQLRKVDPGGPPDIGSILVGCYTVLVGGLPMPQSKSLIDIIGSLRGLARARARNMHEGADARTTHVEGEVGCTTCPA